MSYFTCLEAQNVDKYFTFAWFSGWKAPGIKINRILRVWKVLGGSKSRTVRVWKLKTSINLSHLLGFGRHRREAPREKLLVPGAPRYLGT